MDLSDILYACSCIAGISGIPARAYEEKARERSFCLESMPVDPILPYEATLLAKEESVSYYCTPFYQFYGTVKHLQYTMIFGPVGIAKYTDQEKRNYAFTLGLSPLEFDSLLAAMKQIPAFSPENFMHFLLLLNFYFSGEKKDISQVATYLQLNERDTVSTPTDQNHTSFEEVSEEPPHNTRAYEREMLHFVREGDVEGLKTYFTSRIHGRAGVLSNEQIRQQKNIFIVATTLISRAAMDGGLYEDEAYGLSDMYIRRCEELFSVEAILQLSFQMAMDYTRRVFSIGAQTALSPLVASVVTYIRRNISSDLSCQALSDRFNIHRNQLSAKFKEDTGKALSDFVMHEKIKRAKNLLAGTDKTLSDIADYLGFSSQSHFQTKFKHFTKLTPNEYRGRFDH